MIMCPSVVPSLHLRLKICRQDLRVPVDRGHQAKSHSPPDRLCNLPLVDGAQASLVSVSNAPQRRHVLGHDGEVLCSGKGIVSDGSSYQVLLSMKQ